MVILFRAAYVIFMALFILPGSVSVAQLRHGENHLLHVVGVWAHLEFTNLMKHEKGSNNQLMLAKAS